MKTALYVAIGGAAGALLRFGVNTLLKPQTETQFPVHTFVVNLVGCLLIGLFFAWITRNQNTAVLQYLIITGFLGGFTTFSSYSMEAVYLMSNGQGARAILYMLLSNVCGIGAAWGGFNLYKLVA